MGLHVLTGDKAVKVAGVNVAPRECVLKQRSSSLCCEAE